MYFLDSSLWDSRYFLSAAFLISGCNLLLSVALAKILSLFF